MKRKSIIIRIISRLKKDGFSIVLNILFSRQTHRLKSIVSPTLYETINMYLRLGYWPKIRKPRSLNEKLVYQKLNIENPLFSLVADKVKVRDYVANKVGDGILNEVYFIGSDPRDINFDHLPSKFVIKTNHGSGWNIVVKDKDSIVKDEVIRKCQEWLKYKYSSYSKGYEAHYDNIEPRILVEKFLEGIDNDSDLDYKFYCFHGKVKFIAVDTNKNIIQNRHLYDVNWNLLSFKWPEFPQDNQLKKPIQLSEMLLLAEQLSVDFEFSRIDLYLSKDGIKFGEITISPGGGWDKISPVEWDFKLGGLWKLVQTAHR